ncbi:MAG: hypothetical protein M1840_007801 [Geoglossum simile]|nr:MAG: hypothetical protein M1840_007801 [Geoglossum simile]
MASSHQTGPILQHWNDVPPDFTPSVSSSRSATPGTGARTPSHPSPAPAPVSSLLNTKYNNTSTLSLAVNLGSRAGSRSNSVAGYRGGGGGGDAPADQTARYIRDQAAYDGAPADDDDNNNNNNNGLAALLTRLLALPTTLSAAELGLARERLLLGQQDLGPEQVAELAWVVREVVEGRQDGVWGRGVIVGVLKEWVGRGVDVDVRWLGTLRRVVESLGGKGEGGEEGEG